MTIKTKGLLTVLLAYVIAIFLGFISLSFTSSFSQMLQILLADIIATFVIYAFSVAYKNSSRFQFLRSRHYRETAVFPLARSRKRCTSVSGTRHSAYTEVQDAIATAEPYWRVLTSRVSNFEEC